jgi:acetyl-CoA carboxylase carboxyl transferase subunit beta
LAWFKRESSEIQANEEKRVRTEGLWVKCEGCRQIIWKKELEDNLNVCTKCDYHFRIDSAQRLMLLLDEDSIETQDENLESTDPLNFSDTRPYKNRLEKSKSATGLKDAIINATGTIHGQPVIVSAMEYSFIGGSMGAVVGEAITRAIERACNERKPIIIISAYCRARGAHRVCRPARDRADHPPEAAGRVPNQ